MLEHFGSERLMVGSDWPFARLNGEFDEVWLGLLEVLGELSPSDQDNIFYATAEKFYRI
jgi:L-fuconolactonase